MVIHECMYHQHTGCDWVYVCGLGISRHIDLCASYYPLQPKTSRVRQKYIAFMHSQTPAPVSYKKHGAWASTKHFPRLKNETGHPKNHHPRPKKETGHPKIIIPPFPPKRLLYAQEPVFLDLGDRFIFFVDHAAH